MRETNLNTITKLPRNHSRAETERRCYQWHSKPKSREFSQVIQDAEKEVKSRQEQGVMSHYF